MTMHRPTREEKQIIRACALKSAQKKRVEIQPGSRCSLTDEARNRAVPPGGTFNIAFLTDDPHWDDTDLHDMGRWLDFTKGFRLTDDGRAIIDFYVYSMGRDGELETNVTAYWENGRMVRVEGTGDGVMWKEP